ncbi:MAG: hypothetical protein A2Z25_14910 [Planctomycetes bacterium RBG_16_55_9]|nr:MAG: hypothetical protein A2Z25_14910 [Planctomycetes bacterium RBG_16_55_9]
MLFEIPFAGMVKSKVAVPVGFPITKDCEFEVVPSITFVNERFVGVTVIEGTAAMTVAFKLTVCGGFIVSL